MAESLRFASVRREGTSAIVTLWDYTRNGGTVHGAPVILPDTFQPDPKWHTFVDYRATVARVCELTGARPAKNYGLVYQGRGWSFELNADVRLFACV